MKLLLYDIMQEAELTYADEDPKKYRLIKTGNLSEDYKSLSPAIVRPKAGTLINCIGLATRDATSVSIQVLDKDDDVKLDWEQDSDSVIRKNLFTFKKISIDKGDRVQIYALTDRGREYATIQRIALGQILDVPTSPQRSVTYKHSQKPIRTLTGQMVKPIAGYSYREIELEFKYRVDAFFLEQMAMQYYQNNGTVEAIGGQNLPIFADLSDDNIGIEEFYCTLKDKYMLQSAVRGKLYSIKMRLMESY